MYRMPVNQAFTCEAGNRVMGFPKTVEDLTVTYTDATASFRLAMGGHHVLTLTVPRRAPRGARAGGGDELLVPRGRPYGTDLSMDMGTG